MFGVLTYDAYHLALYLLTALAWGALGLGVQALWKCCAMLGLVLAIKSIVLVLDISRVIPHHHVELVLLVFGIVLPVGIFLTCKAISI